MEERIIFNTKILAGKPIIKGTRISVEYILELLASGMRVEDILAAISYAANALKHEEVMLIR